MATLSRMLKEAGAKSVEGLRRVLREMVLDRLRSIAPARITLDFDGSVQSTKRHAEGTAVGFNKKNRSFGHTGRKRQRRSKNRRSGSA